MQITRGYRTELDLNNKQITACKKHAGAARYAYNWGLKRKQEVYQTTGQRISAMELHRELNQLKQTALPWMTKSANALHKRLCGIWTLPSPISFGECNSRKKASGKARLVIPNSKRNGKGLAVSD